jgi:aryl-alcohol dehydrogenase-like predicted oxidoreductase
MEYAKLGHSGIGVSRICVGGLSREAINREIDLTPGRLGTDYLDICMIHRFDYQTPIEETMEALATSSSS